MQKVKCSKLKPPKQREVTNGTLHLQQRGSRMKKKFNTPNKSHSENYILWFHLIQKWTGQHKSQKSRETSPLKHPGMLQLPWQDFKELKTFKDVFSASNLYHLR